MRDAGVRHIIIGGFGVNAHGAIRRSKDLDIVPTVSNGFSFDIVGAILIVIGIPVMVSVLGIGG